MGIHGNGRDFFPWDLKIWPKEQQNTLLMCHSLLFNKVSGLRPATLLKKETLAQVFSCEFCEISKDTFSCRTALVAASEK